MIHKLRYIDVRATGTQEANRVAFAVCNLEKPFASWVAMPQDYAVLWKDVTCPACHAARQTPGRPYNNTRPDPQISTEIDDGPR